MRRKNRKWVALAVGLYLFILFSAYRWGAEQRIPEGNIFVRLQREGIRRQAEERARAAAQQAQQQEQQPAAAIGERRLSSAGPAYIAARYDATHVVFVVTTDAESRFANFPFRRSSGNPTRIPAPAKLSAPLAGLDELWEPDSHSLHFFPKIVQQTHAGDQWWLSVSPDSTIPVVVERVVFAPTGCSLALGFLASVPAEQQSAFNASQRDYFLIRSSTVESADPPTNAHIAELPAWKASPAVSRLIQQQLNARMKDEVAKIDARLISNAGSPGATSLPLPIGDARPRLKEWLHADQGLARGEGILDYDVRAFRLTPDGAPRLFVRARWTLADATAFLMTAWFEAGPGHPDTSPVLLWTDTTWSLALREGEAPVSVGDRLDFQSVLNEFDADHDGWAELLIHSVDARPPQPMQAASTTLAPYLYTDKGLVPMKAAFRRDSRPPQSCLDTSDP